MFIFWIHHHGSNPQKISQHGTTNNFSLPILFSAVPDVTVNNLTSDYEFILLACDGIWDVLTNQEVVDFVRTRIASKMEPEKVGSLASIIVTISSILLQLVSIQIMQLLYIRSTDSRVKRCSHGFCIHVQIF